MLTPSPKLSLITGVRVKFEPINVGSFCYMNPFKFLLLAFLAPQFFTKMPRPEKGQFLAFAQKSSPWYSHTPIEQKISGKLRAYLTARWLALDLDLNRVTDEVEIIWAVKKVN